jgi:uncharacterized protein YndB with AHSA1/START domain
MDGCLRRRMAIQLRETGRSDRRRQAWKGEKTVNSTLKIEDGRMKITHLLDTPRPDAFSWWAQPEKLEQWSGCAGATRCRVEMDFRVGGAFRQTMDIAGKGAFTFHGVYEEIVEPVRIAWRAHFGPVTTSVLVQFIDEGDRTRVILTQEGFPDERSLKTIQQGTLESFAALDAILDTIRATSSVTTSPAPIEVVP